MFYSKQSKSKPLDRGNGGFWGLKLQAKPRRKVTEDAEAVGGETSEAVGRTEAKLASMFTPRFKHSVSGGSRVIRK